MLWLECCEVYLCRYPLEQLRDTYETLIWFCIFEVQITVYIESQPEVMML